MHWSSKLVVVGALLGACKNKAQQAPAPVEAGAAAETSTACSIRVMPGLGINEVHLGMSTAELRGLATPSLPVSSVSKVGKFGEFFDVGPLHVHTCGDKVHEVWLDDMRKVSGCVSIDNAKFSPSTARADIENRVGTCTGQVDRIGGSFRECAEGGLRLGFGMGDFLQVRVAPTGSDIEDTCEDLLDDQKPVPLSAKELQSIYQQVIDMPELSSFWHVDKPGRMPLCVASDAPKAEQPALRFGGEDVRYLPSGSAEKCFYFMNLTSSARRASVAFGYGPELVGGQVRFKKQEGGAWRIKDKQISVMHGP